MKTLTNALITLVLTSALFLPVLVLAELNSTEAAVYAVLTK